MSHPSTIPDNIREAAKIISEVIKRKAPPKQTIHVMLKNGGSSFYSCNFRFIAYWTALNSSELWRAGQATTAPSSISS